MFRSKKSSDDLERSDFHDKSTDKMKGSDGVESMDFEELESVIWRKHQLRRFFQDRGNWWTSARKTTAWKWTLVIMTGVLIACIGALVQVIIGALTSAKFHIVSNFILNDNWSSAFFSFYALCIIYATIAGVLCIIEPAAGGSGIPEIKSYLNGVNLNKVVRIRVLLSKVIGMCFSVSSGLPLGKEGPMIHTGSIVGAVVSQGNKVTFGFDTSWTEFQDLRNDQSKRDFVTYGAAAGVAAAFKAPIGGILFTLEEGASFWSTALTFRSFFCAMMTMLTISLIYTGNQIGESAASVGVQFGNFKTADYRVYELIIFILIGMSGGILGAIFNKINIKINGYRMKYLNTSWKKFLELFIITTVVTLISFVLPLCWQVCTPKPIATADYTVDEYELLDNLVSFQCKSTEYNQVASLFMTDSDSAMQLLYHYSSPHGNDYVTFSSGALLLFFLPYFLLASITSGTIVPAGLFVPTLMSGAAYGRLIGHILNLAFPGTIASPGTYALIGAASVLGGVARMTIAGAVIILEACGSTSYLLPLMLTFAAARYTGNVVNHSIYEMFIHLKSMPFLEESLKSLGLLNYHPVQEIMAKPVIVINEITRVSTIYEILKTTPHHGFPVLNKDGHLRGLILRKTLCTLLKYKAFSTAISTYSGTTQVMSNNSTTDSISDESKLNDPLSTSAHYDTTITTTTNTTASAAAGGGSGSGAINNITMSNQLTSSSTMFYDTIERNYPDYPLIEDIQLTPSEMEAWLDVRPYMDTAPYTIHESSSVQRCYRFFRTLGLRHLIVLNSDHAVSGIITRKDLIEFRLEELWHQEGNNMQKFLNIDPVDSVQFKNQVVHPLDYPESKLYPISTNTTTNPYLSKYQTVTNIPYVTVSPASLSDNIPSYYSTTPPSAVSRVHVHDDNSGTGTHSELPLESRPTIIVNPLAPTVDTNLDNLLYGNTTGVGRRTSVTMNNNNTNTGNMTPSTGPPSSISSVPQPVSSVTRREARAEREPKTIKKTNI